jgi:hypothetical protein
MLFGDQNLLEDELQIGPDETHHFGPSLGRRLEARHRSGFMPDPSIAMQRPVRHTKVGGPV